MQLQLRSADAQAFGERARFASLKAEGRLDSAEAAAANAAAPKDESADAKNVRATATAAAYNGSIDKQTALAAKFNDAVKAYKAAQAK